MASYQRWRARRRPSYPQRGQRKFTLAHISDAADRTARTRLAAYRDRSKASVQFGTATIPGGCAADGHFRVCVDGGSCIVLRSSSTEPASVRLVLPLRSVRGAPTGPTFAVLLAAMDGSAAEREQEASMSERNGDRARFQKNRKRRLRHRQRIQELAKSLRAQPASRSDARKPARCSATSVFQEIPWPPCPARSND